MNRMSVGADDVRAGGAAVALLDDESPSPGPGCGWPRECGGEQTQASASNGRSKDRKIYLN
ncbi:hypothetical protein, partial [Pseudaminobacter soli (ex Li et al. 2025)]|uniref:hypothetical protein n=1 Tax=Pseudaminobacter soli (ex Li et al. 2025) TaxID=1295366 RepID=UPI001AECF313